MKDKTPILLGCVTLLFIAMITESPVGAKVSFSASLGSSCQQTTISLMSPEAVIEKDIFAQHTHDIALFLSLRTVQPDFPENRHDLGLLMELYPERNPLYNILEAHLVGMKTLPTCFLRTITGIVSRVSMYKDIVGYYVAIKYKVTTDTKYAYNSTSFRLYVLVLDGTQWMIAEVAEIPIYRVVEAGFGFNTAEERIALCIQEQRLCKDVF